MREGTGETDVFNMDHVHLAVCKPWNAKWYLGNAFPLETFLCCHIIEDHANWRFGSCLHLLFSCGGNIHVAAP